MPERLSRPCNWHSTHESANPSIAPAESGPSRIVRLGATERGDGMRAMRRRATAAVVIVGVGAAALPACTADPPPPAPAVTESTSLYVTDGLDVALSPDGRTAYVARLGDEIAIVDTYDGQQIGRIPRIGSGSGIAVGADGTQLHVGGAGGVVTVDLLPTPTVRPAVTVEGAIGRMAGAPDGSRLFLFDVVSDEIVTVDPATGAVVGPRVRVVGSDDRMWVAPDSRTVWTHDRSNATWAAADTVTGRIRTITELAPGGPATLGFSADGARVYLPAANSAGITIVDVATMKAAGRLELPTSTTVTALVASRSGRYLFVVANAVSTLPDLLVLDLATGRVETRAVIKGDLHTAVLSRDGTRLYSIGFEESGLVHVLDVSRYQ